MAQSMVSCWLIGYDGEGLFSVTQIEDVIAEEGTACVRVPDHIGVPSMSGFRPNKRHVGLAWRDPNGTFESGARLVVGLDCSKARFVVTRRKTNLATFASYPEATVREVFIPNGAEHIFFGRRSPVEVVRLHFDGKHVRIQPI